jgi:hypothetical protein
MAVAVALLGAAGGCRRVCPDDTIVDTKRSKPGATAFCQSATDPSRAVWIELYPGTKERRQQCPFVGGRPQGDYHAFHRGGAPWLDGRYEAGRKVGRWTQWSPEGAKVAEGHYREGALIEGAPVAFQATCESVAW